MEYFAWAEIKGAAISTVVSRIHLETLLEASKSVRNFLSLDILRNAVSIAHARTKFKADPVLLDGQVGMALGKICLLFGISFDSDQAVITEMIDHLLQGWAVKVDIEDRESCQQAFDTFIGQLDTSDYSIASNTSIMMP